MLSTVVREAAKTLRAGVWRSAVGTNTWRKPRNTSFNAFRSYSSFADEVARFGGHDDYALAIKQAEERLHQSLQSPTRFQSIDTREDRSDIPAYLVLHEQWGKYISKYRGALFLKNPNDLAVYYQLFSHVQPKTVLEVGTFTGASAMWYHDAAKSLNYDCHIYSVDIDSALLSEEIKQMKPDTVHFIIGDAGKPDKVFPASLLESLPHPWLVVEDSHDKIADIVTYLNEFMRVGDYLVVEDTCPHMPIRSDQDHATTWGPQKLESFKNILRSPVGQNFKIDSFYTDLYGYNCTNHWHGFLRKCS